MLFLLTTLAVSAATPSVVRVPKAAGPPRCGAHITFAKKNTNAHGLHRLDQEPPAEAYLAVDRRIGGCPVPALMRTSIRR